ncbi:phage tail protein [Providencia rettgeri]|uniref:phage tail protein n=1 Tax=Providencia rettgeri TaxID=587 RepID=UPI00221EC7E2|nr:phage tail protein [Providencia rettgeri]
MKYFALLTKLGENLLAQATALGTKLELTHMAVGDGGGSLPTPDTNQTKLIAEKRRAAINTLFIDDKNKNQIIAEQIIPEQDGGWWIREIGLFDKAGNLIAVANCPETYKPQIAEGSGRTQSIRMVLIVSHTESVTLKIDPSVVLATREYVNTEITVLDKKIDALSAQTKLDLNKKFDKANISGQKGNDNDKVPSLNLFTTEIGKLAALGYSYSKIESDGRYQPKGNYAPAGDYATNTALNNGLNGKFDKIGGTVTGKTTVTATGSAISIQPVGSDRIHYDFLNQDGTRAGYIGFGGTANPNSFQIVNDRNGLIINMVDGKILVNDQPILTTRDITQSKGTSTSLVMSQDAATKNFASTTLAGSQSFNSSIYAKESIRATDASGSTGIFRKDGRSFISVVNGTNFIELSTPNKSGTLALTSDMPTPFGSGKYIDVSASRSSGVTYTNTGATPRVVFISITKSVSNPKVTFFVDDVEVGYTYNSSEGALTSGMFIVPIGSAYSFSANSSVRIMELN